MKRLAVLLLVSIVLLSCGKKEPAGKSDQSGATTGTEKPDPTGSGKAEDQPDGEPLEAPSWKMDSEPGLAYFAVEGVGLVGLDNGELFTIIENEHLAKDLHIGADDAVYVSLIGGGIYRVTGRKAEKLTAKYYDVIAASKDGEVWAADMRNIYNYDGKAWATTSRQEWGDKGLVEDMVFDNDGNLYLSATYDLRLKKKDSTTWEKVDTKALTGDKPFFKSISTSPDGAVWLSYNGGVLRNTGGSWAKVATADKPIGADLRMMPNGWLAAGSVDSLTLLGPGNRSLDADKDMLGFDAKHIHAIAGDGRGRIWMATDVGIAIVDDAGKLIQHWKPGTVAGLTGRASKLVVTKGGPKLPKVGPVRKGNVIGQALWDDRKPIPGKTVEMCERPKTMFRNTPCEDAAFQLTTTTAADGKFEFDDVPIGPYGFAIKATDKWSATMGSRTCCSELQEGGTIDIGPLTLRRPK